MLNEAMTITFSVVIPCKCNFLSNASVACLKTGPGVGVGIGANIFCLDVFEQVICRDIRGFAIPNLSYRLIHAVWIVSSTQGKG